MANKDYSEMIEMPVSTCEIVVTPEKKRFKKEKVVKSVNKKMTDKDKKRGRPAKEKKIEEPTIEVKESEVEKSNVVIKEQKEKKEWKFDIVAAQVVAVFALVVAILLTNVFWENSGINVLLRSVFNPEKKVVDTRAYKAFKASVPCSADMISTDQGIMTITGSCAIYSLAEGSVTDVAEKEGKFAVTVTHSNNFKSIISGLDLSYVELGDKVYKGIPVGFVRDGAKVMMYDGDDLITNYSLDGGAIVWES